MAALDVLVEEDLAHNAQLMGDRLRAGLEAIGHDAISVVRGRGLLNAMVITPSADGTRNAGVLCHALKDAGLITKPTHEHIVRLAPPLVINEAQVDEAVHIIATQLRAVFG